MDSVTPDDTENIQSAEPALDISFEYGFDYGQDIPLRRVSYSQYSIWSTCPWQWKLKYINDLREPGSIHTIFGTAMHEAIQAWLVVLYNEAKTKSAIFDIEDVFKERLFAGFKEEIKTDEQGNKTHPCDQATLKEFYLDGCEIIKHVRKYKDEFFPTNGYELLGCEIPLEVRLTEGVQFVGYIDIVIRNRHSGVIRILDLKTSRRGWYYEKKDPKKLNQLLLYKHFYAQKFKADPDDICVEFVILKRKISENSEWVQKRLSRFEPSQGKVSTGKAVKSFDQFVRETFDSAGNVKLESLKPTPSAQNCRWCVFKERKDLCSEGM